MVDLEGAMSAGRRGALGVANSRGDSRPWGGVWRREREVLLRLIGCPWLPDQRKAAVEWRVEMDVWGGWLGRLPLSQGPWGITRGGYRVSRAVPVAC